MTRKPASTSCTAIWSQQSADMGQACVAITGLPWPQSRTNSSVPSVTRSQPLALRCGLTAADALGADVERDNAAAERPAAWKSSLRVDMTSSVGWGARSLGLAVTAGSSAEKGPGIKKRV